MQEVLNILLEFIHSAFLLDTAKDPALLTMVGSQGFLMLLRKNSSIWTDSDSSTNIALMHSCSKTEVFTARLIMDSLLQCIEETLLAVRHAAFLGALCSCLRSSPE